MVSSRRLPATPNWWNIFPTSSLLHSIKVCWMIEKSKALCDLTLTIVSCTQPSRNRLIGSLPTMTPAASKGKKRAIPIPQLMARYIFSLSPIKIKKENISIFRLCLFEKPPFGKTSLLHIFMWQPTSAADRLGDAGRRQVIHSRKNLGKARKKLKLRIRCPW